MTKALIFGGTSEGRRLCEVCAEYGIPIRYCVATADGARAVEALRGVNVLVGRLDATEMAGLIRADGPALVIDATHPYAEKASRSVACACRIANAPLLRVTRESEGTPDCMYFDCMEDLIFWLRREPGNIFVTTGSSHAAAFASLPDYKSRVWLRVLPSVGSLSSCLALGYRPERLICMQGPFSERLNRAMFKDADARILVTKSSGAAGGFYEKIRAAEGLGMLTAVLKKPDEPDGVPLEQAILKIMELGI